MTGSLIKKFWTDFDCLKAIWGTKETKIWDISCFHSALTVPKLREFAFFGKFSDQKYTKRL